MADAARDVVDLADHRARRLDSEAALLGLLLNRPATVSAVSVRPEHYRDPLYAAIHDAIVTTVADHQEAADIHRVMAVLRDRTDPPNLMGRLRNGTVLVDLVSAAPVSSELSWHANAVVNGWRARRARALGERLAAANPENIDSAIEVTFADLADLLDGATSSGWAEPAPLAGRATGPLPVFPVDALTGWVGGMVEGVATSTQTPVDLAACIALAALSTAAGGRAVVEVSRMWTEPVNLFLVPAMPPGSRKSSVFTAMTAPLLAAERALAESTEPRIIEADLARKVAKARAERTAHQAIGANDPAARDDLLAEATSAAMEAEAIRVPIRPRLVADDVTPEAAATLLADHGGRLAILSAEGGIFQILAGRYNAAGGPNLDVFLKGHAGDAVRIDRKGRDAEHIDHPALTLGLAVQPGVLRDIAGQPGFRERGLLARILYALPTSNVGSRQIDPPDIPETITAAYATNLTALTLSLAEWTDPAVLPLTPDAREVVTRIQTEVEPRLGPTGEWASMVDWGSKYVGAVIRIAGLLHLATHLRDGWGRPINATTIENAARIGEYYAAHAMAVFDQMTTDPTTDNARYLLDQLARLGSPRVTRRELFSGAYRGRFRKVTDLDPALALLEHHGYIRRATGPDRGGPGRPASPAYEVHPTLTERPR